MQTNNLPTPTYYHIIHESDITNGIIPDTFKNNIVEIAVGNLADENNQVSVNEADEIFDTNPNYNPPLVYRVKTERLLSLVIDALYSAATGGQQREDNSFGTPKSDSFRTNSPFINTHRFTNDGSFPTRANVIPNTEVHIKILVNLTTEDLTFLKLRGATLNLERRPDYINTITEALIYGEGRTQDKNRRKLP